VDIRLDLNRFSVMSGVIPWCWLIPPPNRSRFSDWGRPALRSILVIDT